MGYPVSWAPCCETWLKKWKVNLRLLREKKWSQGFLFTGFVPTGWAPCWLKNSITWANWKVKVKIAVGNRNGCLLRKNLIKFFKILGRGLCLTRVWAPCCETWLKIWKLKILCSEKKKKLKLKKMFGSWVTLLVGHHVDWKVQSHGLIGKLKLRLLRKKKEVRDFYLLGSYPLVGRHVVNEPKVGCHVVKHG